MTRQDLSNLHSICKEVLGPEHEIGPYSTMRIRDRGKDIPRYVGRISQLRSKMKRPSKQVRMFLSCIGMILITGFVPGGISAHNVLKNGSASGSGSEREERRDSRMAIRVSMHEALTMRHLAQSFVEERTDSGGNGNCKGALTATRLENPQSGMLQYNSKEPDQTEELKSLIKTLQEEKEVLLDTLEQGACGNQGQQGAQETLVGTGKRLGDQDLATERDKESVLARRMDVTDAGREDSLRRQVAGRPAKPRAHVCINSSSLPPLTWDTCLGGLRKIHSMTQCHRMRCVEPDGREC